MTTSKITDEEEFDEILWDAPSGFALIQNELVDSDRWLKYYYVIWSELHDDGLHYFSYLNNKPATEVQEGSEKEFNAKEINEVFPRPITVTNYYTQKELDAQAARAARK